MSKYGVRFRDGWWDLVIGRPKDKRTLTPVWLYGGKESSDPRGRREWEKVLLCQIVKTRHFGWTVVVHGDVDGHRHVEGFKTQWKAVFYAVQIRTDINVEYKEAMRYD